MSDLPETIWAVHGNTEGAVVNGAWADTIRYFCGGIEYRRADLVAPATPPMPLTTAQIMADPRVKAMVDALERIAHAADIYGIEANAEDQGADVLAYAHKSTCNLARAALAQLKEPKK